MKDRDWLIKRPHQVTVVRLARELGVPRAIASVLVNRGFQRAQEARKFLELPLSTVVSPWEMEGMEKVVERVERALEKKEKIGIYGDYDADGVTATALLLDYLRSLGGFVTHHIPHRVKWGYGLKAPLVEELAREGVRLLITVDCGVSNHQEVELARKLGMDVIVTDHHEPPPILPPAMAILHPKLGNYPFRDLAGVGVAMKLVEALALKSQGEEGRSQVWHRYLDLVALGTVGDMALLMGENRFYVRFGLRKMTKAPRPGLAALMEVAGCRDRTITPWEISFLLAPRVNAAGRMGEAERALALLLSQDDEECLALAQELQRENQRRQRREEEILAEALEILEREEPGPFILVCKREWHPGVIGIVASKLAERFQRPAALVAFSQDGLGRGSARSYGQVDIYTILTRCAVHLQGLGGHRAAAGFTLEEEKFHTFKEVLWRETERLIPHPLPPQPLEIEGEVEMEELGSALLRSLKALEPFGEGHPEPLFLLRGVTLHRVRRVGNSNHLKFTAVKGKIGIEAIAFGLGQLAEEAIQGPIDLAFTPELNLWNGEKSLQLKVKAMRRTEEG
ncbi:MAG: single-stranded-DNA-specific exonuclease RecJ [Aquificota bacterium]|nr:MAG: single-stranded-DNA-specific exonuclease RecJ [Aquificota bacterium]